MPVELTFERFHQDGQFLRRSSPKGGLQGVAVSCSVLQCVTVWWSGVQYGAVCCSVVQRGAVWCSVVQCGAVCCSVLQGVAGWCRMVEGVALS